MNYKKNTSLFFASIFLFFSLFVGTIVIIDPLKIYHKPLVCKDYVKLNMREQALGIINNVDFDSLIIGTSMLENTSSKEASEILGGKFINISLGGSDYYERKFVLDYIFKHKKKISKVIYSLDHLGSIRKGHDVFLLQNWVYLYDDNPVNDFKIYLNTKSLKEIRRFIFKGRCFGEKTDLDRPNSWYKNETIIKKFGGLDNWFLQEKNSFLIKLYTNIYNTIDKIQAGKTVAIKDLNEKYSSSVDYINNNIINIIKNNPETEFILILPPYSRIEYALAAQYNKPKFELYKLSIKYLVLESTKYKNMTVYGWEDYAFVDDIKNYKDTLHYNYKINTWMLKAIKKEKGKLTKDNVDNYISTITVKALNYDLSDIKIKIKKYLNKKD